MTSVDQSLFPRFHLLGLDYACAGADEVAAWLVKAALEGHQGYLCITNVHTATLSWLDRRYRRCQQRSMASVPDGMPLVWAGRLLGCPARRVYGADLMWKVLDRGREDGLRHFFLGGTDPILAALCARARRELPGVCIAGVAAPPFLAVDDPAWDTVWQEARAARPQLIWVGLGAPKQEVLMERMAAETPGLMVGVGQAFVLNAGLARRPPRWIQAAGLEWLFRLATEPNRLWRRYLLHNTLFIAAAPPQIAWQVIVRTISGGQRCLSGRRTGGP